LNYRPLKSYNQNISKMEEKIPLKPQDVKFLIIHHTATPRDLTTFEAVKRYHVEKKGMYDIGYHFFIDSKGNLQKGRDENLVGAHCKTPPPSMNLMSLGICLAGDFTREQPTRDQLNSLSELLSRLMVKYQLTRDKVLGHCEVKGTATLCPGQNLLIWLRDWREKGAFSSFEEAVSELEKVKDKLEEIIKKLKER